MTSSSTSWQKPRSKGSSKDSFEEVNGFDLFHQLTYMSAVAAAGISRARIFHLGAQLARPPAAYFRRIQLLCDRLGYDYAGASRTVGEAVKSDAMKSLLLRLSGALASGQAEAQFLAEEAEVQGQSYETQYDRDLASLSQWTDAYEAIIVSVALLIIINLVAMLIYELGSGMLLGLVITAIVAAAGGAWVLSRAAPHEVLVQFSGQTPGVQRLVPTLVKVAPPLVLVVCLGLALMGVSVGLISLVAGLLLFPLGLVTVLARKEIEKKDEEIGSFLRALGGVAESTGTPVTEAITRIDFSSFPALEPNLERLRWRLKASIDPELCWQEFARETGSKLIRETVRIFNDAVNMGADPDTVAVLSSKFSTRVVTLRAKRGNTSGTFSWLAMAMHGTVAGLMVFILEIVRNFTKMMEAAMSGLEGDKAMEGMASYLFSFGGPQMERLQWVIRGMVLLLCLANAFAIIAADGGHIIKISFYLSILLFLSGVALLVGPPVVGMVMG